MIVTDINDIDMTSQHSTKFPSVRRGNGTIAGRKSAASEIELQEQMEKLRMECPALRK
jgi:hypothetical protein